MMKIDRRKFLKLAGATTVLGVGAGPIISKLSGEGSPEPLRGKRWAMAIDLKKCAKKDGCKDCINACHSLHNVPQMDNPKHEVKWIWTDSYKHVFPEQAHRFVRDDLKETDILVLCNHCDNPPCVRVCPTKATWKREDGIVMIDYHRCIGCRYCVAGCPYDARSFNWKDPRPFINKQKINPEFPTRTKGVAEKCNFCAPRLAEGLPPACVEACKEKALLFGDLDDAGSDIAKALRSNYTIRRKPSLGTGPGVYYIV